MCIILSACNRRIFPCITLSTSNYRFFLSTSTSACKNGTPHIWLGTLTTQPNLLTFSHTHLFKKLKKYTENKVMGFPAVLRVLDTLTVFAFPFDSCWVFSPYRKNLGKNTYVQNIIKHWMDIWSFLVFISRKGDKEKPNKYLILGGQHLWKYKTIQDWLWMHQRGTKRNVKSLNLEEKILKSI